MNANINVDVWGDGLLCEKSDIQGSSAKPPRCAPCGIGSSAREMAGVASFGANELGEAVGTRMLAVKQFKSDYKRLEKTDHEHTVFAVCFVPRVAALRKCCNLSCVRYKKDNSS